MVNTYNCCIKLNVFSHLLSNYNETQQCKWKKKKILHNPYKRCLANINLYLLKPSLKFCSKQNCNKAAANKIATKLQQSSSSNRFCPLPIISRYDKGNLIGLFFQEAMTIYCSALTSSENSFKSYIHQNNILFKMNLILLSYLHKCSNFH